MWGQEKIRFRFHRLRLTVDTTHLLPEIWFILGICPKLVSVKRQMTQMTMRQTVENKIERERERERESIRLSNVKQRDSV